jgi:tripartite-type tricarboxylate transporter receptor subunit TctC
VLAFALSVCQPAAAQTPADFYRGKTVFLQIGSGVGGIYDTVGRLFVRHIGNHIPGKPRVVPQNIPGGGSLALANQFASIAARDGSVFGVFNNGMPSTPLLDPSAAKFDPRKFHFLGSPSREFHILVGWHTAPVTTFDDLFKKELIVGATGPGAAPYDFPLLTNALIGTKFKIVTGYISGQETKLAMERGEIHANAGLAWSSAKNDYGSEIAEKKIIILAGFGFRPHPELPNLPMFPNGKTEEERQLFQLMYARQAYGRPFLTPPDVPADRVKALREAFETTLKDPAFLAETQKMNLEIDPVSADELDKLTADLYATPDHVVKRMHELLMSSKETKR